MVCKRNFHISDIDDCFFFAFRTVEREVFKFCIFPYHCSSFIAAIWTIYPLGSLHRICSPAFPLIRFCVCRFQKSGIAVFFITCNGDIINISVFGNKFNFILNLVFAFMVTEIIYKICNIELKS